MVYAMCIICFNMQKLFVLSTEHIHMCCIIPRINNDIFQNIFNHLVLVMDVHCVSSEIGLYF
jgi:hypothetical protein